ncbi:MAG: [acyl-carrier-protein] S-malonyltransferase [Bradymonadales bacterium]|nr:MAG: [acyl-carrier-protein] S-malonyltransferase [Bradymonadales bacterium]
MQFLWSYLHKGPSISDPCPRASENSGERGLSVSPTAVKTKLMSKKLAFVFPGQGSQAPGMGFMLADRFEDFREIYLDHLQRADQALGFSLSKIMKEGPESELKKTEITQPALLCLSSAVGSWLRKNEIEAQIALGHSLGEYSALVYGGSLSFEDAIQLVSRRGRFMREAVPHGKGGMAALIGANDEEAKKLCEEVGGEAGVLEVSVYNCAGQIVISGASEALDLAEKRASSFGVRKFSRLEVGGPFHSSMLQGAGEKLSKALASIEIREPLVPIIFNVDAKVHGDPTEIRDLLKQQVYRPVLWADSIRLAGDEGFDHFVEVGSGKVLTGLIRKILPDAQCQPVDFLQKLEILRA